MSGNIKPESIGVINPYALAEFIKKKSIPWRELEKEGKRDSTLAEILQTEEGKIFDLSTPILNPLLSVGRGQLSVKDRLKKAKKRIKDNWSGDVPLRTGGAFASASRDEMNEEKKRMMTLLSSVAEASAASEDEDITPSVGGDDTWNPDWLDWSDEGDFKIQSDTYGEDLSPRRGLDPRQGPLSDCYLIAALSSVFWSRPNTIDFDDFVNDIKFYDNNVLEQIWVSDRLPVYADTNTIIYAKSRHQDESEPDVQEIWPGVMEKAYAKWKSGHELDKPPYDPIALGNPVLACAEIIQAKNNKHYYEYCSENTSKQLWKHVSKNCFRDIRTMDPMVAWTHESSQGSKTYGEVDLVPNHAYSILGCDTVGDEEYIVLRNPYATKHATEGTRQGTWEDIQLDEDGVFSMKADTFKEYFAGLGWINKDQ